MSLFVVPKAAGVTPSGRRSDVAKPLSAAAALGRFELQVCARCQTVQYPPREICARCLSDELEWTLQSGDGELLSVTVLHHSHDPYFRDRVPRRVGLVRLDCGPSVLVHLSARAPGPPSRVSVKAHLDRGGAGVLVAFAPGDRAGLSGDRNLQEMGSNPDDANILVTDGGSIHAQAIVRELAAAGAARIWVGLIGSGDTSVAPHGLRDLPQVTCLRLDVTDVVAVEAAAAAIGGQLDILINTAGVPGGGLLNLVRHFGSLSSERAVHERRLCPAWVNLLSVSALPGDDLRAQFREAGIRVVNVYPGSQMAPAALGKLIVRALQEGVEEVLTEVTT
jgi:uncharacterized OB-fold protein